jgi:hypothetical protein
MKLVNRILHYICKTNEEPGIWTERIVCDILNIPFNTNRDYLTEQNYPHKLKKDLCSSFKPFLESLNITQHLGNENTYYDFKTQNGQTVSLKTNINGNKVCAQTIGQTSLQKFNEKTNSNFENIIDYKNAILSDTKRMTNLYLSHLFCCQHLISLKFDKGKIYYFKKINDKKPVSFNNSHNILFNYSKDLSSWNNSMTLLLMTQGVFKSFAEFQIHTSRNCIQCRFNLDTLITMVEHNMLTNIKLEVFDLKYKYNIKVLKHKFEEIPLRQSSSLIKDNGTITQSNTLAEPIEEPAKKKRKRN